ncbi:MAG TPA: hypothetical protein PKC30_05250 [Saprospiraceae bacterium]|nr:hypothetical protein [Saprospiraceae bacterium]
MSYFSSISHDTDKGTKGSAGNAFIGFFPNQGYLGYLMNWVSINYEPGMGYVFQKDVVHHSPGGYFIVRPKGGMWQWMHRFDPGLFISYYHGASSPGFQQARIYFFPLYLILNANSFDRLTRVNLRFSWQFSPLSFLYIVYNENHFSEFLTIDKSTISKLSYMKQF